VELLSRLDHAPTRLAVVAERALLAHLEGGCQVPVGALASFDGDLLTLDAFVGEIDGSRGLRERADALVRRESEAIALGVNVAERLIANGAEPILARLREAVEARALAGVSWEEA
jgi:hydroxymethylbilane synthase